MAAIAIIMPDAPMYPELENYPMARASLKPIDACCRVYTLLDRMFLDTTSETIILLYAKIIAAVALFPVLILCSVPASYGWLTMAYVLSQRRNN